MHTTRVFSRRDLLAGSLLLAGCKCSSTERAALLLDVSKSVRLSDAERLTVALQFVSRKVGFELAVIPVNADNTGMYTVQIPCSDPTGYGDVFKEKVYGPLHVELPKKLAEWRAAGDDESNYEGAIERAAQFLAPGKTRYLAIIGDMEHYVKGDRRQGPAFVPTFADSNLDLSGTKVFMGIVEGTSGKPSATFLARWRKAFEQARVGELCISKYGLDGFKDWCTTALGAPNPAFEKWTREQKLAVR
jgi:hypothetical protein